MLDGLKLTVSPLGEFADRETAPVNPFCGVNEMVAVEDEPWVMVRLCGFALSVKSGGATVMVILDAVLALPVCAESPVYVALTAAVSTLAPVKDTEQLPEERVQLGLLNEPAPVDENATAPVGVMEVPIVDVSVAAAVHVDG